VGALSGVRVVEFAGLGPAPFACMLLADMGADVVRVDRPAPPGDLDDVEAARHTADPRRYVTDRGRRSLALDLRSDEGRDIVLRLIEESDALVEGFRPGVMERLGLGPSVALERNPRLVYGRVTGWGQEGPLAQTAGHDINYIALAGALHNFRRAGSAPVPPVNLVGDMGGGGLLLAYGVVCALFEASRSGLGQVVDSAMVDGAAVQMATMLAFAATGRWDGAPGHNFIDTGAPFYEVYETADGEHVAVGAIETAFYAELVEVMQRSGIDVSALPSRDDETQWPAAKEAWAAVFRTKTRDEWAAIFDGSDACVTPVLSYREAAAHPHNAERGTFVERDGVLQPAPAPRLSRTPGELPDPAPLRGEHTEEILRELGY
jgi:alpha-methylacyl-CoA racemase